MQAQRADVDRPARPVVAGIGDVLEVQRQVKALRERFATEVEAFDPFRQVGLDAKKVGVGSADEFAPVAAVAMGLALRKVGDR